MSGFKLCRMVWVGLLLSAMTLSAQEKLPVFLEVEAGVERFSSPSIQSVFPTGVNVKMGPVFAFAEEWRLRLRPQAGVKLFFNEIDEWVTEQLLIIKVGGQVSYDAFYIGQVTFFPYLAADFNWVSNYDAESDGGTGEDESITYSDNYLKGSGFSQEVGMRIQLQKWYVKMGYEFFKPRLKARRTIITDDLASGYLTPKSHPFVFNTFNITIGATLSL
ncbi:hypothetical protein [Parapedobacter pyrenivorans]|uniref:hypothetical protein n=1 Tax=Parapedobacter pyrenivorans TaxID=1305674 RepID=UPI0033427B34